MATKKPAVKAPAAPAAPIIPTVTYTVSGGEVKTFEVPVFKGTLDVEKCPARYIDGAGRLMIRIDSFTAAWVLQTQTFEESESFLYSQEHDEWMHWIYDDNCDVYDEDTEEYRRYTIEEYYEELKKEFEAYGCIYFCATYNGLGIRTLDGKEYRRTYTIDTDKQQLVAKGTLNFSVKYEPGRNMFYHHDNNRAIRASRIDAVTITKKAGYIQTIEYKMADGNTVSEANVCTPEMAHEWINSKS